MKMLPSILPLTLVAALATTACTTMPPPPEPTGPCIVDERVRMRFVGVDFKLAMRDEIQHAANARIARVLRQGNATTMDFREDRLNIMLDDLGRIEGLRCG